jgi:hypothetical protein
MLMHVKIPHDEFNDALREGNPGKTLSEIIEDTKPEVVYFTEYDGQRGVMMVIEMEDASQIPGYAEPWYLNFEADVEFRVAMTPEDLKKAGLKGLAKKWA